MALIGSSMRGLSTAYSTSMMTVMASIRNAEDQGDALDQRQVVCPSRPCTMRLPIPGITEDHFHQQRRAEQEAELHADHGDGWEAWRS